MRTTLTIDDDILAVAKGLAARQGRSLGEVVSDLARETLRPKGPAATTRNGVPLLPKQPDARPATLELVKRLADELP